MKFLEQLAPCEIDMEACAGAHNWGRTLTRLSHLVHMMPVQYVRLFVKSQKNDARDTQAVYKAMCRPTIRFVNIKSEQYQSVLLAKPEQIWGRNDRQINWEPARGYHQVPRKL